MKISGQFTADSGRSGVFFSLFQNLALFDLFFALGEIGAQGLRFLFDKVGAFVRGLFFFHFGIL